MKNGYRLTPNMSCQNIIKKISTATFHILGVKFCIKDAQSNLNDVDALVVVENHIMKQHVILWFLVKSANKVHLHLFDSFYDT